MKWHKKAMFKVLITGILLLNLMVMLILPGCCGKSVPPEAAFMADSLLGIVPFEVQFHDHSIGTVTDWVWDFNGDALVDSTESSPIYIYDKPGTYSVSLAVGGPGGTDVKTKTGYITVTGMSLQADFESLPTSGAAPLEVQFVNYSSNEFTEWSWDFDGNGEADSTNQNPSYIYENPGVYTITLTAKGDYGSDTMSSDVTVYTSMNAAFTAEPTVGTAPLRVQFTDQSTGDPSNWFWDFDGNGTIDSIEQNPVHTYESPGAHTVSLEVSGIAGTDVRTESEYIQVTSVPLEADFNADLKSGSSPIEVQFTDQSSGDINCWQWDFDSDGIIDSTTQNPVHVYKAPGGYSVSLTVSSQYDSVTATKVDYIEVVPKTVDFVVAPHLGITPLEVQFTDRSTSSGNGWEWDFDNDGVVDSTQQNPIYTYDSPGTYSVSLRILGIAEPPEIKYDYIQVSIPSVADFYADITSGALPLQIQYSDQSTGQILYWLWDFDNNGTVDSTDQNPVHVYDTPGTYTVSLTVGGAGGVDTQTKTDYMQVTNPPPVVDFVAVPISGNVPLRVDFVDQCQGNVDYWFWDFDNDGQIDSTENSPSYVYTLPGTYTVSLTVSGPGGTGMEEKTSYIEVDDPWLMFGHNAQRTGRSYYSGPQNHSLYWSYDIGGASDLPGIASSPAISADDTIYVGTADGSILALNPNGTQKWAFDTGDYVSTAEWILSSPAIGQDGTIYFGSQEPQGNGEDLVPDQQDGTLWALDSNGNLKWKYDTQGWILSSPAIDDDGIIYFGSGDGYIYALRPDVDLSQGERGKWTFNTQDWILSSPAIGMDGTIYIGSQGESADIYDPASGHLWAIDPDNGSKIWDYSTVGGVLSSPAVGDDGTIYFGTSDGKFYALNSSGTPKWNTPYNTSERIVSSPAIGLDGTVYFGSQEPPGWREDPDPNRQDGNLWAIHPDGSLKWSYSTSGWILSSPAIDPDGVIYFGCGNSRLYAIYPDRTIKWTYTAADWILSSPTIGDGVLYIGSSDGKLHVLKS
ncbi:MAG: PKD domain-containing protein [Chloroflexota bacterium]|nr:PKD domain-containing protein [Chloroflexota bacterium]